MAHFVSSFFLFRAHTFLDGRFGLSPVKYRL
jgi:hypothetical protein